MNCNEIGYYTIDMRGISSEAVSMVMIHAEVVTTEMIHATAIFPINIIQEDLS